MDGTGLLWKRVTSTGVNLPISACWFVKDSIGTPFSKRCQTFSVSLRLYKPKLVLKGKSLMLNRGSGVRKLFAAHATWIPTPDTKCQPLFSHNPLRWGMIGSFPSTRTPGSSAPAGSTEAFKLLAFVTCLTKSGQYVIDHDPFCMMDLIWLKSISLVPPSTHIFSVAVHLRDVWGRWRMDLIQATVKARDFWVP